MSFSTGGRSKLLALIASLLCAGSTENSYASANADCTPSISAEPMSVGRVRISLSARLMAQRKVHLQYQKYDFVRRLDPQGELSLIFDCFLGDKVPLIVSLEGCPLVPVQLHIPDLDRITVTAIVWRGSVNLDLHAFEYAAGIADENHVWRGSRSSPDDALERIRRDHRGHGFIGSMTDGTGEGDQVETYTFVNSAGQTSGVVQLALDYESRSRQPPDPDTCGTGLYADLEYEVIVLRPDGHVARSKGSFTPISCNQLSPQTPRFYSKVIPQIFVGR